MPAHPGEKPILLLIEDDIPYRASLRDALSQQGYLVHEAGSAIEGLAVAGREQLDLVLLDLKLGGASGLAFLRAQKDRLGDILVIVLTAHPGSTAIEAMGLGAYDYL